MPDIKNNLVLEAGQSFSVLDRFIQKTERLNAAFERSQVTIGETPSAVVKVSGATENLIENLGRLETKFQNALTDREIDKSLSDLEEGMRNVGLVWTDAASGIDKASNLAKRSLQELAEEGLIAANSTVTQKWAEHQEQLEKEAQAAERATEEERKAVEAAARHERIMSRLVGTLGAVGRGAKSAVSSLLGFNRVHNPLDGVMGRLTRMAALLFSTRRLMQYMREAMERAPDSIGRSYDRLKTGIQDGFARVMVSALAGMQRGVDKLNASLNSPAGQRFFRGLEQAAEIAGEALGRLFEIAGTVIEWIKEHSEQAFTAAGIAAAFFGAQMLIANAGALAGVAAVLLFIGVITNLVGKLNEAGVTSEQIFEKIGQGAGWLYAFGYNLVADAHNLFATFAEFFATVFDDPVASVARLFFGLVDTIIGVVETAAKAIDALTGSGLANAVSGVRSELQKWVDGQFGESKIKIDRMEKIDPRSVMEEWGEKGSKLPGMFDLDALGQRLAPPIKSIDANTSAIRRAVDLAKEDIKSLVDVAERRYVNQVNLTNTTPQITIYGQNTGRTNEDRQALADAIQVILAEQTASGGYVATAMP